MKDYKKKPTTTQKRNYQKLIGRIGSSFSRAYSKSSKVVKLSTNKLKKWNVNTGLDWLINLVFFLVVGVLAVSGTKWLVENGELPLLTSLVTFLILAHLIQKK